MSNVSWDVLSTSNNPPPLRLLFSLSFPLILDLAVARKWKERDVAPIRLSNGLVIRLYS